jgi:hypothetical protein
MLVENTQVTTSPAVPSGTECGYGRENRSLLPVTHSVPDGTGAGCEMHHFYQHIVPDGTTTVLLTVSSCLCAFVFTKNAPERCFVRCRSFVATNGIDFQRIENGELPQPSLVAAA